MVDIFQWVGVLGLLLISAGILIRDRRVEDVLYILGGVCLEVYSIVIGDVIFMVLQVVFILAAVYDLIRLSNK